MSSRLSFLASLILGAAVAGVHGFDFNVNTPTECGQLTVTWSGGTAPFHLLLIPPGLRLQNISIPTTASGTFSTTLNIQAGRQVVFAMGDATGETAGGVSAVASVGARAAGASCDTTVQSADFFYNLDSPLQQCVDYPFTGYDRATKPITIYGFEPRGTSFSSQAPANADTFSWKANRPTGTQLLFYVTDADGKNGGVSSVTSVGASSDTTCLTTSTTSASNTATSRTGTSTSRTGAATSTDGSKDGSKDGDEGEKTSGSKIGIIVGAAAGGFVALGILAFIIVFCRKKKRGQAAAGAEPKLDLSYDPTVNSNAAPPNTYLLPSSYSHSNANLAPGQSAAPYDQDSKSSQGYTPSTNSTAPLNPSGSKQTADGTDFNPYGGGSSSPPPPTPGGTSTVAQASSYGGYSDAGGPAAAGGNYGGYGAYGAAAVGVAAAAAGGQGYYQQQQQQQQYGQQYSQQQYGNQQQYGQQQHYDQQQYGQQQYPQYQQQYQQQQYPQQYGQQYGQYQQQYPPNPQSQSSWSQGGSSGFYATNADPDTHSGYAGQTQYPPVPQPQSSSSSGAARHKATASSSSTGKGGAPPPVVSRPVVVHQDIEEAMDDLPEELPPQYSESRAPIPGLPNNAQGPLRGDRKG